MHDKELQHILKDRFEGYTSPPSEDLWNAIEAQLEEDDDRRAGWYWWLSPLGVFSLLTGTAAVLAAIFWMSAPATPENSDFTRHTDKIRIAHSREDLQREIAHTSETTFTEIAQAPGIVASAPSKTETTPEAERTVPYSPATEAANAGNGNERTFTSSPDPVYSSVSDLLTKPATELDVQSIERPGMPVIISPLALTSGRTARWELVVAAGGFFNSDRTLKKEQTWNPEPDPITLSNQPTESTSISFHERTAEVFCGVRRSLGNRFYIGTGLATAYSREKTIIGPTKTESAVIQWSYGIPLTAGIRLTPAKRVQLYASLAAINEFDFRKKSYTSSAPLSMADQTSLYSESKGSAYRFGAQFSLDLQITVGRRLAITTSGGYRMYLAEKSFENVRFTRMNYFSLNVGMVYLLK